MLGVCKECCYVALGFVSCVLVAIEPLSFDSPKETDVVRRFPMSAEVFVAASAGTLTRDPPHGDRTLCHSATEALLQK